MSRISAALLVLILLLALILRVWGLGFGLPYMFHPDEPNKVSIAQRMFHTGDLNPHYFLKPTLFIYLNALLYFPYAAVANAAGVIASAEEIQPPVMVAMGVGRTALPSTILLGRSLTVLVGMIAVGLTYLLGRRIYGIAAGLLAALLAALSPTLVEHSRSITENMFLVAAILATVIFALKVLERGAMRDYLLAGICAGFAASFKYPGALALSLLPAAHFLRCGWTGWRDRSLYLGLACAPLAFLLGTPFALFDLPTFLDHVFFEAEHYSTGHPGMEGNSLRWYVSYAWQAEGPALLFGVVGLIWGVWRGSRPIVLLTIFPVTYFVFITRFEVRNDRTFMPIIPFLLIAAAGLLVQLAHRVREATAPQARTSRMLILGLLIAACLMLPASDTLRTAREITTHNSRTTAVPWIAGNLPAGARIAVESYAPFVDPARFDVEGISFLNAHPLEWYQAEGFDYLIFGENAFGRFYAQPDRYTAEIASYDALFNNLELLQHFDDGGYDVQIYAVPQVN